MKIVLRAFGHWHAPKLKVCQKVGMSAEPRKSYAFYISKPLILRPAGQEFCLQKKYVGVEGNQYYGNHFFGDYPHSRVWSLDHNLDRELI